MKRLKFHEKLVPLVLDGSKTCTWRLFDDKDLRCGDECVFINASTLEEFAKAELISVKETRFKYLTKEDWDGHEPYDDPMKMYADYSAYYSSPVDENTLVKIIKYVLL